VLFVVISLLVLYAVNALNTQDWLWFTNRVVESEPVRIVIVDQGQRTTLVPGSPGFDTLAAAASAALSAVRSTDLVNLGLSDETLADFQRSGVLLELYYDQPVSFHTQFRAGEPTQVLIPIAGRHAGNGYFFRGAHGEWWFGAIQMADPAPLYRAMAGLGYAVDADTPAG
jgi:hypothetical protein